MQSMYWLSVATATIFLLWVGVRTDEIPTVLGLVGLASAILGWIYPSYGWITWLALGAGVFVGETLVHFGVIAAPYPPGEGLPLPALVAYIPAAAGVSLGCGLSRMK